MDVGIFVFTFFFKSHLGFQNSTQGFYVDFSFLDPTIWKSEKKVF